MVSDEKRFNRLGSAPLRMFIYLHTAVLALCCRVRHRPTSFRRLVQCSSKAVHELAAECAGWWCWLSPDPGFGVGVELCGGYLHGVGDLGGVDEGLSGESGPA